MQCGSEVSCNRISRWETTLDIWNERLIELDASSARKTRSPAAYLHAFSVWFTRYESNSSALAMEKLCASAVSS